jgi:hypothetical protein
MRDSPQAEDNLCRNPSQKPIGADAAHEATDGLQEGGVSLSDTPAKLEKTRMESIPGEGNEA